MHIRSLQGSTEPAEGEASPVWDVLLQSQDGLAALCNR